LAAPPARGRRTVPHLGVSTWGLSRVGHWHDDRADGGIACGCRRNLINVTAQIPATLQARAARLAARIALGRRSDSIPEAIELACDLLVADIVTQGVLVSRAINSCDKSAE
jgi:hypothetical protein